MKKFVQRSYYGGLRESVLEQLSAKDRKDYQRGSAMLKALGDPQRAMLVDALSAGRVVKRMQQLVSWSRPLEHHLKTLRENGVTHRDGSGFITASPGSIAPPRILWSASPTDGPCLRVSSRLRRKCSGQLSPEVLSGLSLFFEVYLNRMKNMDIFPIINGYLNPRRELQTAAGNYEDIVEPFPALGLGQADVRPCRHPG